MTSLKDNYAAKALLSDSATAVTSHGGIHSGRDLARLPHKDDLKERLSLNIQVHW